MGDCPTILNLSLPVARALPWGGASSLCGLHCSSVACTMAKSTFWKRCCGTHSTLVSPPHHSVVLLLSPGTTGYPPLPCLTYPPLLLNRPQAVGPMSLLFPIRVQLWVTCIHTWDLNNSSARKREPKSTNMWEVGLSLLLPSWASHTPHTFECRHPPCWDHFWFLLNTHFFIAFP